MPKFHFHLAGGSYVVYMSDQVYAAHGSDYERDAIWQEFWRTLYNEQSIQRREAELQPLEDAAREIALLKEELACAERVTKHFEEKTARLRDVIHNGTRP